jgi:hypothetical protein
MNTYLSSVLIAEVLNVKQMQTYYRQNGEFSNSNWMLLEL